MKFNARVFILPGLGNSGPLHWQSRWEKRFPEFRRIEQEDWDTPVCKKWVAQIHDTLSDFKKEQIILVGHSLACSTIGYWAREYGEKIWGALLVAPSDTEADSYPPGTTGFKPMPLYKLPFPSIVVSSDDDIYVTPERAREFATAWGSELITLNNAGHINASSGLGDWEYGITLLKKLDSGY
jgi:uncharacterized protein